MFATHLIFLTLLILLLVIFLPLGLICIKSTLIAPAIAPLESSHQARLNRTTTTQNRQL